MSPVLYPVPPDEPCDRCDHASKYHAAPERGSGCMMMLAPGYSIYSKHAAITGKVKPCFCDHFEAKARTA